jgi:epoxyqueuosine reductase QueG
MAGFLQQYGYKAVPQLVEGLKALMPRENGQPGLLLALKIPKKDEEFIAELPSTIEAYLERLKIKGGFFICLIPGNRMEYTCSNCHFVCHPDKEVRKARYQMLTESGVVIQEPDGTRRAVSPEEAKE